MNRPRRIGREPLQATFASKQPQLLLLTLIACLFAGCATTRPVSDVALGAGGACPGDELSNGDPLATAAGAAGGVIAIETLHCAERKQSEKAYATGYDKDKSDAVKQHYWLYVSMQRPPLCNSPNTGLTE